MAVYGQLNKFSPGTERLSVYLERFQMYVSVNDVPREKQVPLFLTVIGGRIYGLLHTLMAPESPTGKSLSDIVAALKAHFEPTPVNIITHHYTFHRRNQGPSESIAEYMAELRRLATHCNFGEFLDQALRDRLVFGMRSEATQKHLLTEKEPTLERVLELALSLEAAQKNAQTLKAPDEQPINKIEGRRARFRKPAPSATRVAERVCYRCGRTGHPPTACSFVNAKCHSCGKIGHIAKVCRSVVKQGSHTRPRKTQWVDTQHSEPQLRPDEPAEEVIWRIGAKPSHPYRVVVQINNQPLSMEIDTGAAVSVISKQTQERLFPNAHLDKSPLKLSTYTAEAIPVVGQMEVELAYANYTGRHKLYVVGGNGPSLLGCSWLKHLHLNWASIV